MVSAEVFREGYASGIINKCDPFEEQLQAQYVDKFLREGWLFFKNILTEEEVDALKAAIVRKSSDERINDADEEDQVRGVGLMRMFEYNQAFRDLIVREPLISIIEKILGSECHVVAQNALVTRKGNGIVNWHIDDHLYFPFLSEIKHQELRYKVPCYVLSVMFPLTDVEAITYGPTQLVPRSHFSGSQPTTQREPAFEGQEASTVYANAGDAYILNSQLWHRGAQNDSERVRFMATITYGRRFVSQRFYPFLNYQMPSHVLEGCDERLLRLLGKHPKGPYG